MCVVIGCDVIYGSEKEGRQMCVAAAGKRMLSDLEEKEKHALLGTGTTPVSQSESLIRRNAIARMSVEQVSTCSVSVSRAWCLSRRSQPCIVIR
jgi:hypothetical protein